MIREWVENLLTLSNKEWNAYSFSREPIAGRIKEEDREEYGQKASDCAIELADFLRSKYGYNTPEEYAKVMGVELLYKSADMDSIYAMFASYEEPNTITVFLDNAEVTDKLLFDQQLYELVGNIKTCDLLIAHELYHYLEQTIPGVYTAQKQITLWKLGPVENKSRIICLEEIGAMAFAKELTGLKCSPYIFDVIMLYTKNPQRAKKLYELIMSFKVK